MDLTLRTTVKIIREFERGLLTAEDAIERLSFLATPWDVVPRCDGEGE